MSPPHKKQGKKDPGSGWSHVLVTNLSSWKGSKFLTILSLLAFATYKLSLSSFSPGNLGKLFFDCAVELYILIILQHMKLGLESVKKCKKVEL